MEQPIACTLTRGAYRDRTAELAGLAARALRSREQTAEGERLVFTDSPDTERELRAAIAAESSCCAFLRMDLTRRRRPGARHRRPAGRPADHRGAVRVSVPEKLLGAGALVMALCCAAAAGSPAPRSAAA